MRVAVQDEVGRVVAVHQLTGSNDLIEPWCVVRNADRGEVLYPTLRAEGRVIRPGEGWIECDGRMGPLIVRGDEIACVRASPHDALLALLVLRSELEMLLDCRPSDAIRMVVAATTVCSRGEPEEIVIERRVI